MDVSRDISEERESVPKCSEGGRSACGVTGMYVKGGVNITGKKKHLILVRRNPIRLIRIQNRRQPRNLVTAVENRLSYQ